MTPPTLPISKNAPGPSDPDADLLLRSVEQPELFSLLHQKFFPILCRYCLGFLKSDGYGWHEAEDLAEEILAKVFTHRATFRGESKVSTWMFSIARNLCLNHATKTKTGSLDEAAHLSWEHVEEDVQRAENEKTLWGLLDDHLTREEREVFLLSELEELGYEDIAELLGCSVGKVFNLRSSAIEKLKSRLTDLALS